jgi:tRNA dimethylallyltransferase
MMAHGLVSEVEWLIARGYGLDLPSMSGLGYRQIGMHLKGELGIEDAVRRIKTETHRYVRQQYNWFSLKDTRIHWFEEKPGVHDRVSSLLAKSLRSAA